MELTETTRKLTAVFVADVVGYSRLMGEDPDATVKTLAEYREVFSSLIQFSRGRVVNAPGDSILAEFVSVVDAVNCAVKVQDELAPRNEIVERFEHLRSVVHLGGWAMQLQKIERLHLEVLSTAVDERLDGLGRIRVGGVGIQSTAGLGSHDHRCVGSLAT